MDESGRRQAGLWEAFISVDSRPADPEEAREVLRELGMSEDIEQISSEDGRYNVVIPIALRERISSEGSYTDSVELRDGGMDDIYMEDIE
jgi:hypothetical protein